MFCWSNLAATSLCLDEQNIISTWMKRRRENELSNMQRRNSSTRKRFMAKLFIMQTKFLRKNDLTFMMWISLKSFFFARFKTMVNGDVVTLHPFFITTMLLLSNANEPSFSCSQHVKVISLHVSLPCFTSSSFSVLRCAVERERAIQHDWWECVQVLLFLMMMMSFPVYINRIILSALHIFPYQFLMVNSASRTTSGTLNNLATNFQTS